jgi:hypothetical protein
MKRVQVVALFVALVSSASQVEGTITCSSPESRIRVVETNAKLSIGTAITGFNGTLELVDASADRISGQPITFAKGNLETGDLHAFFTGKYNPTGTDTIALEGSHRLRAAPGTVLPTVTVSGSSNKIEGAPIFSSAITLADGSAAVAFALQNKLNQSVTLNSGTVSLNDSLSLADGVYLSGAGSLTFNGRTLNLQAADSTWTGTLTVTDDADLTLNGDTALSGQWTFNAQNGQSIVNGNGNVLDLTNNGTLHIAANHTLVLTDLTLKGVGSSSGAGFISFADANSTLSLVNVTVELAEDWNLDEGVVYVLNSNSTVITGGRKVNVVGGGKLKVDGVALGYDPLTTPDVGNVPGTHDGTNIFLLNNGTVRSVAGGSSDLYLDAATNTLLKNEEFGSNRKLYFRGTDAGGANVTLDGNGFAIDLARVAGQIDVANGKNAIFTDCVLRNFNPAYVTLNGSGTIKFAADVVIEFSENCTLSKSLPFDGGSSTIKGNGCTLTLSHADSITVAANTTLALNDVKLAGVTSNLMRNLASTSKIEMRNAHLGLTGDYTFGTGAIDVYEDVSVAGNGHKFVHTSPNALTIKTDATLMMDRGTTYSYNSTVGDSTWKSKLAFQDASARLFLNGCTLHSTYTGIKLETGTVVIQDKVTAKSEATLDNQAMAFDNALTVEVLAGAMLDVDGRINFE